MKRTWILAGFMAALLWGSIAPALDLSSTPQTVREALGEPKKIEPNKAAGFETWNYKDGKIIFREGKIIGFDQKKDAPLIDLGKPKDGVFLQYNMKAEEIPFALGTPSRIEPDADSPKLAFWIYDDLPAPDEEKARVAVYDGSVMAWSVGDKMNHYHCHLWDEKRDEPESPAQKRILKEVGQPSAVIRKVRDGKEESIFYIFHMKKSGIFMIEFREGLKDGYRIINSQGNPATLDALSKIHPNKKAKEMTHRDVLTLATFTVDEKGVIRTDEPSGKKESVWDKINGRFSKINIGSKLEGIIDSGSGKK